MIIIVNHHGEAMQKSLLRYSDSLGEQSPGSYGFYVL